MNFAVPLDQRMKKQQVSRRTSIWILLRTADEVDSDISC